jgi:hypothetical protein
MQGEWIDSTKLGPRPTAYVTVWLLLNDRDDRLTSKLEFDFDIIYCNSFKFRKET